MTGPELEGRHAGEPASERRARLRWYVERLRAMTAGEVAARVARDARHRTDDLTWRAAPPLWRRRWEPPELRSARAQRPRGFLTPEHAHEIATADPQGAAELMARADSIMRGQHLLLGHCVELDEDDRTFTRDVATGFVWPASHGKRLDYRSAPANPKWAWELNRCQDLPVLTAAWLLSRDDAYAEAAASTMLAWIAQQRVGRGIAWTSGFEAGIRAISLAAAYDALAAAPALEARLRGPVLRALWQHARFIERDPSTHSSANNHRIGELVGLLAVGCLCPELGESRHWTASALGGLRSEAGRQILADGTGAEQSFAYTLFTLDLLLVAVALADATGAEPPAEVLAALERAARALWAQIGADEPEPTYGDDDSGRALPLDGCATRTGRGVASTICARLGSEYARAVAGEPDLTGRWLFGARAREHFSTTSSAPSPGSEFLPDSGLAVLRRGSLRVTFDAGPLGYLRIAAHGHADALGVTISSGASALVVDPGTGTYFERDAEIRDAFRGTGFHATALVDGVDQSVPGGPFLWSQHARSWLSHVDTERGFVAGEHDGYLRLRRPVRHRRAVVLLSETLLLVYDRFDGDGPHALSLRWPLAAELVATLEPPGSVRARDSTGDRLALHTTGSRPGAWSVACGERDPFAGWVSPHLEAIVPAPLAAWTSAFDGRLDVATSVSLAADQAGATLTLREKDAGAEIEFESVREALTVDVDLSGRQGVSISGREGRRASPIRASSTRSSSARSR